MLLCTWWPIEGSVTENTLFKETKITITFVIHCHFRDIVHCHLNQDREYYLH